MKERLDVLLVKRGLAPSREKAKTMIMEGNVFVNNNREDKAGSTFAEDAPIEIHGNTLKYVSRGGLKLEKAMTHFSISLDGHRCFDGRVYGLHAAERGKESVFRRCGIWPVCMETAPGPKGCLYGKNKHPLCHTGRYR